MGIPWYEWRNLRNRLVIFGRAVQGTSPYRVLVEPDKDKCPAGYCNFSRREIAVNPGIFDLLPREQYQLTKAILVHEAGHRRFTVHDNLSPVTHTIANILEDERIERLMADEFAGLRPLVKKLSLQLYKEAQPVDQASDCPGQVVSYFLQLRWAQRVGKPVKGGLCPRNQELWHQIEPLVYGAWEAETSKIVDQNAELIVEILGLKENQIPEWIKAILEKLGTIEGQRGADDKAERGSGADGSNQGDEKTSDDTQPFDGEVPPHDRRMGTGLQSIEPTPYIHLEEKVKPLVQELIEQLAFEETPTQWKQVERGGKLSLREYLRDRSRPFLSLEPQAKTPPTIALKVIVDHSTSLNHMSSGVCRMESIAESVMMLHLVCLDLGIPHEVIVTPQQYKIADLDSGERGKALIAGLNPAKCGYEDMGLALEKHADPMSSYPEDIKLVLCLTDGVCNDAYRGKDVCQKMRGKVEVIGVLLDPDEHTKGYVSEMFGADRTIACNSADLPQKLGNVLRAISGV